MLSPFTERPLCFNCHAPWHWKLIMANRKILVVDDERDLRIFVSTVVETSWFAADVASDGSEAIEKASLKHG